jgi:hypothetical protein
MSVEHAFCYTPRTEDCFTGILFSLHSPLSEHIGQQMGAMSDLFRHPERETVEERQMV